VIVTVTLNPALDLTYRVDALIPHTTIRVRSVTERPGGKGLNVARVLHALHEPVLATGLLGGPTGARVRDLLAAEHAVAADFVPIAAETRRTIAVLDDRDATLFNEPGPRVTAPEWATFRRHYANLLPGATVVVLAGSLPAGLPTDAYAHLIRLARQHDVRVVLDTSGPALAAAVPAGPDVVKPNEPELRALLSRSPTGSPAAAAARPGADSGYDGPARGGPARGEPEDGPTQGEPAWDGSVRGGPAGGEPGEDGPTQGEPVRSEPVRSEPVRGEPVRGEPARGEPARGEPADGPARGEPAWDGSVRGGPAGGEPGEDGPPWDEPAWDEPARGEPVRGEPAWDGPVRGEPAWDGPVRGEPAWDGPVRDGPVRDGPVRGEPVRGEPVRGEPVRGEPVRGGRAGGEPGPGEPAWDGPVRGGRAGGEPAGGGAAGGEPSLGERLAMAAAVVGLGARAVVGSFGERGLVAVARDGAWRAVPPEVVSGNPTGAGDACVAGLARGLRDGAGWPDVVADAVALAGAAVAAPEAGAIDMATYERLRSLVTVDGIAHA
jgi:fructose-1-phosphate kinase PfkB-like protein